jgi:hypothetical protein
MSLRLKTGKVSSDGYNANTSNAYYAVVDIVNVDKRVKKAVIPLLVFKNKASRIEKKIPVISMSYVVEGDLFDLYFSAKALKENDLYAKAYEYILNEVREPPEDDEEEGILTWRDWETDE